MRRALILPLLLTACAGTLTATVAPLPLPSRPDLPTITAEELAPLPDDVYRRLVERDLGLRQYVEQLETIIRSTREE